VPADNLEVVRRVVETWNAGAFSEALALFDPEVETTWRIGFDVDGTYVGHAELVAAMEAFWGFFAGARGEIEEAFAAGEHVVVVNRFRGQGKRSGIEIDMAVWQVWTVRDGKVVRWRAVRSREEALDLASARE
jgi:ketosteroid isomerase-like protein